MLIAAIVGAIVGTVIGTDNPVFVLVPSLNLTVMLAVAEVVSAVATIMNRINRNFFPLAGVHTTVLPLAVAVAEKNFVGAAILSVDVFIPASVASVDAPVGNGCELKLTGSAVALISASVIPPMMMPLLSSFSSFFRIVS